MLRNLVNAHDVRRLVGRVRRGDLRGLVSRLLQRERGRVEAAWASPEDASDQWWVVPPVWARWARLISGTPEEDFITWAADRYVGGHGGLRALSLACGTGYRTLRWAESGRFAHIDALDIAPARVAAAVEAARARRLERLVRFAVADLRRLDLQKEAYDVVLAEMALHHLTPLASVLARLARALVPGGLLLVDEYAGPRRFQWTSAQLDAANRLLRELPPRFRMQRDGKLKVRIIRPSRLSMILSDPSEAVESDRIRPLLRELFDVAEMRGYGGNVLHLVLAGIAQNFAGPDGETRAVLDHCFAAEDRFLREHGVESDFIVAVCRHRGE